MDFVFQAVFEPHKMKEPCKIYKNFFYNPVERQTLVVITVEADRPSVGKNKKKKRKEF